MNTAFQRGMLLYHQGRFDLADREFRRELMEEPDNPIAHAFLALCLTQQHQSDEALREVNEAIRIEPGMAFCHYVRGAVLSERKQLKEAKAAVEEAIQLDPMNADYLGLLSQVEIQRGNWTGALEAADRGLALDPEHDACINLRAMALVHLGRKEEAAATLGDALANNPDNAHTHANQGWALLHRGDHVMALEHFREALRLDPEMEWARIGIVEALKARYLVYRQMLRFSLWMSRKSQSAQWMIILAFIFGRKMLDSLARSYPALAPIVVPVLFLSFGFLLLTWISGPLFDLLLRLNPFGRLALSRDQRVASSWVGGCFLLAVAAFVVYLFRPDQMMEVPVTYFGLLLFPLVVTFNTSAGRPRTLMGVYTLIVAALGLPLVAVVATTPPAAKADALTHLAVNAFVYFTYGCILSTWLSAFLRTRLQID